MNHAGEITVSPLLLVPTVAVITNVGTVPSVLGNREKHCARQGRVSGMCAAGSIEPRNIVGRGLRSSFADEFYPCSRICKTVGATEADVGAQQVTLNEEDAAATISAASWSRDDYLVALCRRPSFGAEALEAAVDLAAAGLLSGPARMRLSVLDRLW